jgi:hypothetical protein
MSRPLGVAIVFVGLIVVMRALGMDFQDLYAMARSRLASAASDTGALVRGEYSERTAERIRAEAVERIRAEAASIPAVAPGAGTDEELRRELAAERKPVLQEKADQAERVAGQMVRGDLDGLKRQVEQNARMAGGPPRRWGRRREC